MHNYWICKNRILFPWLFLSDFSFWSRLLNVICILPIWYLISSSSHFFAFFLIIYFLVCVLSCGYIDYPLRHQRKVRSVMAMRVCTKNCDFFSWKRVAFYYTEWKDNAIFLFFLLLFLIFGFLSFLLLFPFNFKIQKIMWCWRDDWINWSF